MKDLTKNGHILTLNEFFWSLRNRKGRLVIFVKYLKSIQKKIMSIPSNQIHTIKYLNRT